jgi:hypothetical protein
LTAACQLFAYLESGCRHRLVTCAVTAGGGALLKNEGAAFILVLALAALVLAPAPGGLSRRRNALALALGPLAMVVPWHLYSFTLPSPDENHLRLLGSALGVNFLPGALPVARLFLWQTIDPRWYGSFFLMALCTLPFLGKAQRGRTVLFPFLAAVQWLLYTLVYSLAYSAGNPSGETGVRRLFAHSYPLATLSLALAVGLFLLNPAGRLGPESPPAEGRPGRADGQDPRREN